MVRDCLDYLGNVVGELELPDDTSEETWAEALAVYSKPPPPIEIPDISPRQMKSALLLMGITEDTIVASLAGMPSPQKELAKIAYDESLVFIRNNELVDMVGQLLGWSSKELDDLWIFAQSL